MSRGETKIRVRSGGGGHNGQTKVRLVVVANRGPRTLLWLGSGEHYGLAWVSGEKALREIRDALDAALDSPRDPSGSTKR